MATNVSSSMRSVRRCFRVMELFDLEKRPMAASEIARKIDAPLSSVIDLLKCISELGYISYDGRHRKYAATPRLGRLGEWLVSSPLNHINHTDILETLQQQTRETVSIFSLDEHRLTCIACLPGLHAMSFNLPIGEHIPLFGTAAGSALLSTWTDVEIDAEYAKWTRKGGKSDMLPKKRKAGVNACRRQGYCAGYNLVIEDVGAVAMAVEVAADQWVVFTIAGLTRRIRENEAALAAALQKSLGQPAAGRARP